MENNYPGLILLFACFLVISTSCESQQKAFDSPPGYDFNHPKTFKMPVALNEISGITFYKDTGDTLYAEQDEEGKVFRFTLGDINMKITRFAKKGDFEDISVVNNFVIMLRSDGVLFTLPITEIQKNETDRVQIFDDLLPKGEYEGLASENGSNKLYVLCKHCRDKKTAGGEILRVDDEGVLTSAGNFEVDISKVEAVASSGKNFHPSALAQNPFTKEWFVLSSVNKMLVVTDERWKVRSVYLLDPSLFVQPEGITFDRHQNLYISNEQGSSQAATVLLFSYNKN